MTSTPPPTLPQPGDLLAGKYRVEGVLGQGGMGVVYAAQHELLAQRVAVKVLLAEGAQRADASLRFLQEARAAARVQHENIARVSDVGTLENGMPYMVMEFLEGHDLSQLLQGIGPLEVGVAVDYVLQALEAVAQAHALGIVHRDLKPANLFLAKKLDGNSIVKVLDFGISKTTDPLHAGAQTSTQSLLGSPYYMSPEQLRSSKNVDRRADLWSVGIILYELLTGVLPFQAETLGGLFAAILEQEPAPMSSIRKDVPPGLDAVVSRCLSRRADDRFADAAELAWALSPYATPAGLASAERIQSRGMGTTGNSANRGLPAVMGTTSPGHTTGRGRTAASWQTSQASPKPAGKAWVFAALGVTAFVAAGGYGVWRWQSGSSASSAASAEVIAAPSSAPPAIPPPPVVSAQPTAAPAKSVVAAAPSSDPAAEATANPPSVNPPSAANGRAAPPNKPRPAPRPNAAGSAAPRAPAPTYDPTKDTRF
jgi:serine/threonine protein kinase